MLLSSIPDLPGGISRIASGMAGFSQSQYDFVVILSSRTVADSLIEKFDLEKVYETEYRFKAREELNFPPFSRLILIEMSSEDLRNLKKLSEEIAGCLLKYAPEGAEVMGPVEAPIARRKGKHRMHILLKSPKTQRLQHLIRYAIETVHKGRETIDIDVDPIDLM